MKNPSGEPWIERGTCYCLFAYNVGFSIDLNECERRIATGHHRDRLPHRRRAPRYFEYSPAPLRVTDESRPLQFGGYETLSSVEAIIYDFAAVTLVYSIPVSGPLSKLRDLSDDLYDNPTLLADSRTHIERLLNLIGPAVSRLQFSDLYEDYIIFQIESLSTPDGTAEGFCVEQASLIAQILRAEPKNLSDGEVRDALSLRMSFSPNDVVIVDWHAALLVDRDGDDVRAVLEFANAELLEMRFLDQSLDTALEESYQALSKRMRGRTRLFGRSLVAELERFAEWQTESATLFEGVNNSLKLIGDQYLARVYRLVSQRLRLQDWDSSILRKLETLESVYSKMSDSLSARRLELLEWIIIVLIAVSIIIPFLGIAY